MLVCCTEGRHGGHPGIVPLPHTLHARRRVGNAELRTLHSSRIYPPSWWTPSLPVPASSRRQSALPGLPSAREVSPWCPRPQDCCVS